MMPLTALSLSDLRSEVPVCLACQPFPFQGDRKIV